MLTASDCVTAAQAVRAAPPPALLWLLLLVVVGGVVLLLDAAPEDVAEGDELPHAARATSPIADPTPMTNRLLVITALPSPDARRTPMVRSATALTSPRAHPFPRRPLDQAQ